MCSRPSAARAGNFPRGERPHASRSRTVVLAHGFRERRKKNATQIPSLPPVRIARAHLIPPSASPDGAQRQSGVLPGGDRRIRIQRHALPHASRSRTAVLAHGFRERRKNNATQIPSLPTRQDRSRPTDPSICIPGWRAAPVRGLAGWRSAHPYLTARTPSRFKIPDSRAGARLPGTHRMEGRGRAEAFG
jgi:hypothetical protein